MIIWYFDKPGRFIMLRWSVHSYTREIKLCYLFWSCSNTSWYLVYLYIIFFLSFFQREYFTEFLALDVLLSQMKRQFAIPPPRAVGKYCIEVLRVYWPNINKICKVVLHVWKDSRVVFLFNFMKCAYLAMIYASYILILLTI